MDSHDFRLPPAVLSQFRRLYRATAWRLDWLIKLPSGLQPAYAAELGFTKEFVFALVNLSAKFNIDLSDSEANDIVGSAAPPTKNGERK